MPDPRIVAFDLSLTSTGVASTNGDGTVDTWTLKTSKLGPERLAFFRLRISEIVTGPFEEAAVVALEGYSFGTHNHRAEAIGELGGVVRLALYDFGIPTIVISPKEIKKYATGKGNASKEAVGYAAVHRSGRVFANNDEADAWWLHEMLAAHYDLPHIPMPSVNRTVLDKIDWPALRVPEVTG